MRIAPVVHDHVQGDLRVARETLENVLVEHRPIGGASRSDHRIGNHTFRFAAKHEVRAARNVDDGLGERLVHGDLRLCEPADPGLVAESLPHGLPQHDRRVLDGVVGLDVDVARGLDREVEAAVLPEGGEHVIEKRYAGVDVRRAGAVQIDVDGDRRFRGGALDARPATGLLLGACHDCSPRVVAAVVDWCSSVSVPRQRSAC